MPIRIKAIEKKMNVGIHKDTYRYQMQPELYSTLCSRSFAFCILHLNYVRWRTPPPQCVTSRAPR